MKRFIEAGERHYFRVMPLLMRAFVIAGLTMITLVAISQLLSGDRFTVFYAVALPILGAIWLASSKVRQMGSRSE